MQEGKDIAAELTFRHFRSQAAMSVVIRSFGAEWKPFDPTAGLFVAICSPVGSGTISRISIEPLAIVVHVGEVQDGGLIRIATGIWLAPHIDTVIGTTEASEEIEIEIVCGHKRVTINGGRDWKLAV